MIPLITIDADPVLVHLGPLALSWYGIAVMLAIAAGVALTLREAERKQLPVERIMDSVLWIIGGGFVGARLLHVVDRWDYYSANPGQILALHNGGLAVLGAIIGGAIAAAVVAWRLQLPLRRFFDAAAPGLVLGQAIGRFGCLFTGDALGPPTDGTWGVVYTNPAAMPPELGVAYQPTFFYEQLWDLAIFGILMATRRRLQRDGQLFALTWGSTPSASSRSRSCATRRYGSSACRKRRLSRSSLSLWRLPGRRGQAARPRGTRERLARRAERPPARGRYRSQIAAAYRVRLGGSIGASGEARAECAERCLGREKLGYAPTASALTAVQPDLMGCGDQSASAIPRNNETRTSPGGVLPCTQA